MDKRCDWCGGGMLLVRRGARFCSTRCRVASHRAGPTFPDAMTSEARWVRADGKRPITVAGRAASSTDQSTWSSFADVSASKAGDGMGVMLGGGLACWDLDGALVDGTLTNRHREIVDAIAVPVLFVEVSVSGRGIHIFTAEPESRSHQGAWGGHYSHSRFIRTTGIRFDL